MTKRFSNEELMEEVKKVRKMMKEVENECNGQYELLEDHLSELLEDVKDRIVELDEFCSTAEFDNPEAWEDAEMEKEEMLEVLYDEEQYQGDTDGDGEDNLTLEEYLGEERFQELMEQLSKMEW